ncbi:MAG: cell wall hydrolase [Pseudomonadota bacterium]
MTAGQKNPMTGASVTARIQRWWKAQTSAHQKEKFTQAALGAACFGAFVMAMPVLAGVNAQQQDELQFRDRSVQLAEIRQDELYVTSALTDQAELMRHDWMRTVEYSMQRDPSAALSRYAAYDRDKAAIGSVISLEVPKRAEAEDLLKQKQCLAEAVYYEARSEAYSGQLGVAEVIMNRVNDHRYPNTICDVVFQGATRTTGCQFTFTCDGAMTKKPRGAKWDKAQSIAAHVLMDLNEKKTAGATHYHATYVNPVWNSGLIKTKQIGTHIFYRFPRGSEWSVASARQAARLAQRRSGLKAITPADAAPAAQPKVLQTIEAAAPVTAPEAAPVQTLEETPAETDVTVADLNARALRSVQQGTLTDGAAIGG